MEITTNNKPVLMRWSTYLSGGECAWEVRNEDMGIIMERVIENGYEIIEATGGSPEAVYLPLYY